MRCRPFFPSVFSPLRAVGRAPTRVPGWWLCVALLPAGAAQAMVPVQAAQQVAQGLAHLDPWIPVLLSLWLLLGAYCWLKATQPLRAQQRLRMQLGADAPVAPPLSPWLLAGAALCVTAVLLLGWGLADPAHALHALLVGWDEAAQQWSQQHVSVSTRAYLRHVTDVGDVLWLGMLSVLVAALLALRRRWLPLQIWVFAIGLNGLSTRVLKNAFDRARPQALHELVTSGASFPSGHTAGSVVVYGLLWWLLRGRLPRRSRVVLGTGLALLVALIAASRIWLEAHFASDVVGGGLLGLAILGLAIWALERGRAQP
ncbi:undecaprenyl-diphosphatase [Comamonas odontotermitis]|uniref:Undecaprenyl-diphosphatase n=1 Tax=Comamonas odontotermitis TaxID=379895 RepID=A0ABR6RC01_9BURK|nr:phosphatase PAP2 family protein [Comamonas odontotermitis]MBB6576697.1 undecaprenyl-diphosphatase [Comamonas odontotermitis]